MKNVFLNSTLLIISTSIAQAGDMGEISNINVTTPFVVGEANASFIAYQNESFNNINSTQLNNVWGGRFGAGLTRKYRGKFSLTSELGYGYYGRVRTSFINSVNNNYYAIDGLDALVGCLYTLKELDIFFKAGAMIENKRVKGSLNLSQAYQGDIISGTQNYNYNFTQVLPALKTGGIYNFNANFGLTLSYMHVFGSSTSFYANKSSGSSPLSIVSTSNIHTQNPSFDSILFGIQYNLT